MAKLEITKEDIKHALLSILIGAIVAFITSLLEGLLGLLKESIFNYTGVPFSMIFYLKRYRIV